MLARDLRAIAETVSKSNAEEKAKTAADYLRNQAVASAQLGNFGTKLVKSNLPFDTETLKKAITILSREGFTCSIHKEIVQWYSNTDCDEEEYFIMNW
jgi:hypothetical protein